MKRYALGVTAAALPIAVAATVYRGPRVPLMLAAACAGGLAVEAAFAVVRRRRILGSSLLVGVLLPLTLPIGVPFWMVAAGAAFGVLVGEQIFGGPGKNLFSPVLVGRCFLTLAYPVQMTTGYTLASSPVTRATPLADALTGATPLAAAGAGTLLPLGRLLLGGAPGCVGETARVLVLAGGVLLVLLGAGSLRIVAGALGTVAVLGWAFHRALPALFPPFEYQLLTGGLLFGVFFLATDPSPAPTAPAARLLYGCLTGLLVLLLRGWGAYPEGVSFAILLANAAAPLIDRVTYAVMRRGSL